jgi:hypothetical protein
MGSMFEEDKLDDFDKISNLFGQHTLFEQKKMRMKVEPELILIMLTNNNNRE